MIVLYIFVIITTIIITSIPRAYGRFQSFHIITSIGIIIAIWLRDATQPV